MATRNLHDEPFDEGTLVKLGIFEDYLQAWIPTFVMAHVPKISIFDFFAGPGFDLAGTPGSPIRLLNKIKENSENILKQGIHVDVHLNEFDRKKHGLLEEACSQFLVENPELRQSLNLYFYREDFDILFAKILPKIGARPSLVYLDQNGIKFFAPRHLRALEKLNQTDFLCFLSASFLWRFGEREEFRKHLKLDMAKIKEQPYKSVHRNVVKQMKDHLSSTKDLKLYPFSIQKGANIYGIIFGASHPQAVEKFLDIAWRINNINGEANFDIDDDAGKRQGNLFESNSTKLQMFDQLLREKILSGQIKNNSDAYSHAHAEGHPGRHASKLLIKMKKDGEIAFEGRSPLVNYKQIFKNRRIVEFVRQNK